MPTRTLVIALDAAEATLLERWTADGSLPQIKTLIARAAGFKLRNEMHRIPGTIWTELATGNSVARHGLTLHSGALISGEAEPRTYRPQEIDTEPNYWVRAARAGLKVATLDLPLQAVARDVPGLQLTEWGSHERHLGTASEPASLIDEVTARYGPYPVFDCETHGRKPENYAALITDLKRAVPLKTALFLDVLAREQWDLVSVGFTEAHCAGHQLWHFHDPAHPWYRPDDPPQARTALFEIYKLLDDAVGKLVAAVGPDTQIVLLASHGMGPLTGGSYLIDEAIARLGYGSAEERPLGRLARRLQAAPGPLAGALRSTAKAVLGRAGIRRAQAELGALRAPLTDRRTRACALFNNRCGAIRLNLKGRDPFGSVAPGNEAAHLLEEIREALLELRHLPSGAPLIASIATADEAYGRDHHPNIPDLIIEFRSDLGPLEACYSPRFGRIDAPNDRYMQRSGDHTAQSRLWIASPRLAPGPLQERGHVIDVAPTILDLVGLEPGAQIDGRSLLRRLA